MLIMYLLCPIEKMMINFTSFWNFAVFHYQRTAFILVDDVPTLSDWNLVEIFQQLRNFDTFNCENKSLLKNVDEIPTMSDWKFSEVLKHFRNFGVFDFQNVPI